MINLAIRDDDVNYFTSPNDLKLVYSNEVFKDFPVSFAVIPFVKDVSTRGACPETRGNRVAQWIGDNKGLVLYLSDLLSQKKADILLHGITHEYLIEGNKRLAEMEWRREGNLAEELFDNKKRLSDVFHYPVSVFVAPSNKISHYGINAVIAASLHYSGIIPLSFKRDVSFLSVSNYVKRWIQRGIVGLPYPNILNYGSHKELNACTLQGYNYLVRMFDYCCKINSPMAINVHYWHLRDNPSKLEELVHFVNYALAKGAIPSRLSELFLME